MFLEKKSEGSQNSHEIFKIRDFMHFEAFGSSPKSPDCFFCVRICFLVVDNGFLVVEFYFANLFLFHKKHRLMKKFQVENNGRIINKQNCLALILQKNGNF